MSLSLYDITVPALLRGLENLSAQIDKAVAFAAEQGIDEQQLLQAKLIDDMFDFTKQVQRVSDTAKFGGARLSQQQAPSWADEEASFAELKERLAKTADYLRAIPREAIDGNEKIDVRFKAGPRELHFVGEDYARSFLLPNFYFHATAAYAILRHKGVPIGKMDYLGRIQ